MRLSGLEIFGFKSFADKVTVEFSDGITAIVGPNGCGKSNIIDAIKWVLGEQGVKSLRGQSMQDVIFAGTAQRKPISVAEVNLTIENTRNILPLEFSEVTISRRLYRSGESDYFINKSRCRLKDITDLFLDTGVGAHAYSLIEQGMVDSILSEDVEQRRRIFEEAAGIVKYKVRRKQTLSKLKITEDHLTRVEDIIEEIAKRVRSLKYQVGKARRYNKLNQKIKELNVSLYHQKYLRGKNKEGELILQQEKLNDAKIELTTQIDSIEVVGEKLVEQKTEKDEALAAFSLDFEKLTREIGKLESDILLTRERKENLVSQRERGEKEQKKSAEKLESIQLREKHLLKEVKTLESVVQELKEQYEKQNKSFSHYQQQGEQIRKKLDEQKREQLKVNSQKADKSRQLRNLTENLQRQNNTFERLRGEVGFLENSLEGKQEKIVDLRRDLDNLIGKRNKLIGSIEGHYQTLKTLKEDLDVINKEGQQLKNSWEVKKERLEVLSSLKENYEGYNQGVRNLLSNKENLRGIIGTFADLIEVEPRLEMTLEAALADKLQHIVAETTQDAQDAINYLRSSKKGRASVISLDLAREIAENPKRKKNPDLEQAENLIGAASELVKSKEEFEIIKNLILHEVAFTEDFQSALEGARNAENGTKFVAFSGETVDSSGVITGGKIKGEDFGILKRNRQIKELSTQIEDVVNQLEKKENEREQKQQKIGEEDNVIREMENQRKEMEKQIATTKTEVVELDLQLERTSSKLSGLVERKDESEKEIKALTERKFDVTEELEEIEKGYIQIEKMILETERELGKSNETYLKLQAEINQLKVDLIKAESQLKTHNDELRRLERAKQETEKGLISSKTEVSQSEAKIEIYAKQIDESVKKLGKLQERHQEKSKLLKVQQQEISDLSSQIRQKDSELKGLRNQHAKKQQELHQLNVGLVELQTRAEEQKVQILDQYNVNLDEIAPPEEEVDELNLMKEIEINKEKLGKLGNVNAAAEEEFDEESKRLEFLTGQRNDLLEAKYSLNEAITKINRRARVMFTETFQEIKEKFIKTFGELFIGGEADIRMAEDTDPLEGDIEIYACPGGKRMKNIRLLSGGEKALTAIALLFSIYMVKPSPFCILDEVDAPLDDANVNRFTNMLRRLSENTQFIVITHNKRTMEICDNLYGITMDEPGISRLLSITLKDA